MTAKANPASMQIRSLANKPHAFGHLLRDASRGWKDVSIHSQSHREQDAAVKTLLING